MGCEVPSHPKHPMTVRYSKAAASCQPMVPLGPALSALSISPNLYLKGVSFQFFQWRSAPKGRSSLSREMHNVGSLGVQGRAPLVFLAGCVSAFLFPLRFPLHLKLDFFWLRNALSVLEPMVNNSSNNAAPPSN